MLYTLQVKITGPRLPNTLLQQLTQTDLFQKARECALVLICAPAGYGKTTFASAYCHTTPGINCWYSLDEADNETVVFGRYLVASLAQHLTISEALQQKAALGAYQNLSDLFHELLLELERCPGPIRLVFDDFHLLQNASILVAFNLFLEYLPQQLQIVISSRTEPETLQRLCSQQTILRVTAQDLLLGEDAVVQLFSAHGHTISGEEAKCLNHKAQGWVTGLKLIALNHREAVPLAATTATLQGTEIRHYLFHEVYAHFKEPLRQFLTKTSICERFSRDLAKVLTGIPQVEPLLQAIDQQQFFLSRFGEDGAWFRYHPLLAEFLRTQIENTEEVCKLHLLAATWWQEAGQLHIAAHHYALSGDINGIKQFLLDQGETLFNSGHAQALAACLASLPASAIAENLHITAMYAWLEHVVNRRPERVLPLIQAAEQALRRSHSAEAAQARIVAELGSVQASMCLAAGDIGRATVLAETALQQWSHEPQSIKCAPIHSILCDIAMQNGDLAAAMDHSLRAAALDRSHGFFQGVFWHLSQQAVHAYYSGDLKGMACLLDSAMTLVKQEGLGYLPIYDSWLRSKARLLWLRLQFADAEQQLKMAVAHNEAWPHEQVLNYVQLCQIALARQDVAAIDHLGGLLEAMWFNCAHSVHTQAELGYVLVQLWILRGDSAMLQRFILKVPAPVLPRGPDMQTVARSLALAHLALHEYEQATNIMVPALELARQAGLQADFHQDTVLYVAMLWQQGQEQCALALLQPTLLWVGDQQAYMVILTHSQWLEAPVEALAQLDRTASHLLQLLKQRRSQSLRSRHNALPDAVRAYGLTRQEWQLLQLIALELSNDAICDSLHISMNTVRSHIRRVNKKLGIATRGEAIKACVKLQAAGLLN